MGKSFGQAIEGLGSDGVRWVRVRERGQVRSPMEKTGSRLVRTTGSDASKDQLKRNQRTIPTARRAWVYARQPRWKGLGSMYSRLDHQHNPSTPISDRTVQRLHSKSRGLTLRGRGTRDHIKGPTWLHLRLDCLITQ